MKEGRQGIPFRTFLYYQSSNFPSIFHNAEASVRTYNPFLGF